MLNAQFNKKMDFLCFASAVAGASGSVRYLRESSLEDGLSLEGT